MSLYAILLIVVPVIVALGAVVVGYIGVNFYISELRDSAEPGGDS